MRIKQLDIASWRQFRDVSIPFPDNGVICLVGANGSGKSSILYLIRHIYAILGVPGKTMGVPEQRLGTWLESDSITATVTVEVPDGHKVENLEFSQSPLPVSTFDVSTLSSVLDSWNGDLIIDIVKSVDGQPIAATAANIAGEDVAKLIGSAIADQIASIEASVEALVEASVETTSEDQYFHLGVLRWSGEPFNPYSGIDQGPYRSRTRAPQKFTVHAAGGWGAMLGPYRERQAAWKVKAAELAMQGKLLTDPYPEPPLKAINRLSELLPHVSLSGYSRGDAPTFRTPGGEVTLDQLSAGEQSIVSTLVTAEALGPSLKTILIDEPEMHFNGELVRRLVTVLREEFPGTLIVLATHSFDVIESAGDINTWWLLRDAQTFEVNTALRWIDGGPLSQLAYELGVPALSFTGRTYIAAEGEHGSTFDCRFKAFGGNDFAYRFVPRTSSLEVERFAKMFNDAEPALGQLADLLPMQEIRVGGVMDRDFRSQESVDAIESSGRVHVWRCTHEENLFLQPDLLDHYIQTERLTGMQVKALVKKWSGELAGKWIRLQVEAQLSELFKSTIDLSKVSGNWEYIGENKLQWATGSHRQVVAAAQVNSSVDRAKILDKDNLVNRLVTVADSYSGIHESDELWLRCLGKDVFEKIRSNDFECTSVSAKARLETKLIAHWTSSRVPWPMPVEELRRWLTQLSPFDSNAGQSTTHATRPQVT